MLQPYFLYITEVGKMYIYMYTCMYTAGGASDPMVRPPPETVDDLEDITGETGEVPAAGPTPLHVSRPDKDKVHSTAGG